MELFGSIVFIGFGSIFLYGNFTKLRLNKQFRSRSVQTEAEIASVKEFDGTSIPSIRFTVLSGQTVEVEPTVSTDGRNSYQVGEKVSILYLPDDPKKVTLGERAEGLAEAFAGQVIWMSFGIFFVIIGISNALRGLGLIG